MRVPSDSLEPAQPVSYLDLDLALPTWVVLQLAHLPCPEMVLAGHSHSSPGGCLRMNLHGEGLGRGHVGEESCPTPRSAGSDSSFSTWGSSRLMLYTPLPLFHSATLRTPAWVVSCAQVLGPHSGMGLSTSLGFLVFQLERQNGTREIGKKPGLPGGHGEVTRKVTFSLLSQGETSLTMKGTHSYLSHRSTEQP